MASVDRATGYADAMNGVPTVGIHPLADSNSPWTLSCNQNQANRSKKQRKITALIVTHDISEAISMSDRVIILSNRPATVKEILTIDFEMKNRTPLNCRESPKFSMYFDNIWKGLNVHE